MTTLKIDWDHDELPAGLGTLVGERVQLWGLTLDTCWVRKTAHGWHIGVVVREDVPPMEQVAMQAALGDDPARVAWNILKVRKGRPADVASGRWNVLYAEKVPL